MRFALFFPQTSATANDLLELRHRADHFIQNNQLCHFAVGACGEQFRCGRNHRILRGNGNKVVQLTFAVGVAASDAHHIVGILLYHVGVLIHQCNAHSLCCVLCCAEHDSLCHAVCAFQIARDFSGNLFNAVLYDNVVVVVAVGVDSILDFVTVNVALPLTRTPALTDVSHNIDDLERREEAVLDPLFQAVCINRLTEIINIGNVLRFLGRCSHADLRCRRKVFQNFAPVTLLFRRTTVTLIHNNQVEEIRAEQLRQSGKCIIAIFFLIIVIARKLLIQREVDLIRGNGAGVIFGKVHLMNDFFQWSEVLLNRLVNKVVAVSQVQDFLLHTAFQQAVYDLERCVGFACTGSHNQQNTVLPSCDSIHCAVDGNALVVAGRVGVLAAVIRLCYDFLLFGGQSCAAVCACLVALN